MNPVPTPEEFDQFLSEIGPIQPFRPYAAYYEAGDCIEFFAKPDQHYAQRIDDLVTVYRSRKTTEIIGLQLKGIRGLCEKHPAVPRIVLKGGSGKLSYLLIVASTIANPPPESENAEAYGTLLNMVGETKVEAEFCAI